MPTPTDYKCTNCGGTWSHSWASYKLGPIEWSRQHFDCRWCGIEFVCPREVDHNSWAVWCRAHQMEFALYPFLVRMAGQVEAMLNGPSQYTPKQLEFPGLACPKCQRVLTRDSPPDAATGCLHCGKLTGQFNGPDWIDVISVDGPWPPIL